MKGRESFPKSARLRKRPEFLRLSRIGRKVHSGNFIVISKASDHPESRLGVTVSSKVGNSVVRNRIKRQVREYFRRHREELPQATDYLVIARDSAAKAEAGQLTADLARSFAAPRPPRKS